MSATSDTVPAQAEMELTEYDRQDAQLLLKKARHLMSGREYDVCEAAAESGEVSGSGGGPTEDDFSIFENFRRQFIPELAQWRREAGM